MSESMARMRQMTRSFYRIMKYRQGVDKVSIVSTIWPLFRMILSFLRQKYTNLREVVDTFDTPSTPLRYL